MPFTYGTVGKLAFFFAGDDSRAEPERLFDGIDDFFLVFGLAHGLGHGDSLQVGAESVKVHAELGHDAHEFGDAGFGNVPAFINVFAQAADFHLLEFGDENLARFGRRGRVFKCGDEHDAAVAANIDCRQEPVIHFRPR